MTKCPQHIGQHTTGVTLTAHKGGETGTVVSCSQCPSRPLRYIHPWEEGLGLGKKEEEEEETAQLAHAASAPSFSPDVRSSLEENVGCCLSAWIHSCQIRTLYRCCIGTFCERSKDFTSAIIFARQTLARLFCMISAEDYALYEVL